MSSKIRDIIRKESFYEFKELYGFTFVFENTTVYFKDTIASADIKPVGIIYAENDDYYFAPFDKAENLKKIIKEYVKFI